MTNGNGHTASVMQWARVHKDYTVRFTDSYGSIAPEDCPHCGRYKSILGWVEDEESDQCGVVLDLIPSIPAFIPAETLDENVELLISRVSKCATFAGCPQLLLPPRVPDRLAHV